MKDLKSSNIYPIDVITSKLWAIFDILRSEPVSSEDYNLILFLLTLYKDGYLGDQINSNPNDSKYSIENRIFFNFKYFPNDLSNDKRYSNELLNRKSNSAYHHQIIEISGAFDHSLKRLSKSAIQQIIKVLFSLNIDELKLHFSDIFDNVLYRLAKSQGRQGGEFIQPKELSRLVCNLADLKSNSTVFNPFAGVASFGVFLDDGQSYLGQEINYTTWAIGALRLLAYERPGESKYVKEDSILNWPDYDKKFDFIVSNPPYGLRLGNNYKGRGLYPEYRTAEQLLIEKGVSSLTPKGKLIAILPNGFLFKGGSEQRLREKLVESDLVDSIISLPGGLLLNTGMPLVILVLNKAKRMPGVVKFIDAKNFVESKSSREKRLNDYTLLSVINKDQDSDSVRIVPNNKISEFGYNLSLPKYFQKEIEGVRLREILEYIRPKSAKDYSIGRVVRVGDLKEDALNPYLVADDIEVNNISIKGLRVVEENCLLFSNKWKQLKPTIFRFKDERILITSDIIAFKIKSSLVNEIYLINELNADYVKDQLNSISLGVSIPFIKVNDLFEIKIKLPSIKEQIAKVQGIEELSSKIKSLEQERNALAHGFGKQQFNEFASLKHTLGTPRQNILSYAEALISFFEKNPSTESEQVSTAFKQKMGVDLNSAFQAIKHDINFISELLEKGENGLQLSEYNLELINLQDLEKLVTKVKSASFNYTLKIEPLKGYNKAEQGIISNSTLLKILLDNILLNAQKHGFDSKNQSNEVVIDISLLDDNLIIDIKNNGKKFPKGFDKENFIAKYSTANPNSGTGIGGYDINRIIEYFNGTWDLILNEDTIYPVRFRIQFPIKPII